MIQPPALVPGDTVGIIATARKILPEELAPAVEVIRSWGLNTRFADRLFQAEHQFAGTDAQRAADMQQMLDDDSIKAVIIARGGYGSVRMIDRVDLSRFSAKPKWIIGYSDITVLHSHLQQCCQVSTLHGSMPVNFPAQLKAGAALETLKRSLFGEKLFYTIDAHTLNRRGEAEAVLTGGNLSVLYSLMGSVSFPEMQGKILFLEDLDEYLYHIDRMMMGLKRAGALSGLAGLLVGGMTDMKDNTIAFGKTAEEIIHDTVSEFGYPVCFGFPAGHITDNRALKLGARYRFNVKDSVTLQEL